MSIAQRLSKFAMGVDAQGILSAAKGGTGNTSGGGGGSSTSVPTITNISYPGDDTAANPAGGQTITLTGTNFATGATVIINGSPASAVSVVNTTQITFTSPALSAGSYIVYVVNTDGTTAISVPGLQISGVPAWTTAAGTLGTVSASSSVNYTVAATGDTPISYSVYSGSLPSGLTLNSSTGVISGNAPSPSTTTTYNFTVRSTDAQNQDTDRAFSITVNASTPPGQQAFTTVGTTSWTVPAGVSSISAVTVGGGEGGGGNSGTQGGKGGNLRYITSLAVTPGETLTVVVGAGGTTPYGPGGGSRILRNTTVLLEAGCDGTGGTTASSAIGGTIGGGNGGTYGSTGATASGAGGGGAGGYSGNGGKGGDSGGGGTGAAGTGGGGGGGGGANAAYGWGGSGGGVGILGQGPNGTGGSAGTQGQAGVGGSGGSNGRAGISYNGAPGGTYGGGGGGSGAGSTSYAGAGGQGAVRIIWGAGRAFPSTLTTDQ